MKDDGAVFMKGMRKSESEREREGSCGAKDIPRVFWGLCICVRTWWEPKPTGFSTLCWPS